MTPSLTSQQKSKRTKLVAIAGVVIVIVGILWYRSRDEVWAIKREISRANFCETNADCKVVTGQCPFGCYVPVNVTQGDRIEGVMDAYSSACTYKCAEYKGVDCVDKSCTLRK